MLSNSQCPHKGRANKGNAACGVLYIDQNGNEYELSKFLGEMTPPEAEFNGLIFALDNATSYSTGEIEIWMDSELVIKWMNKQYRMHKEHIRPLYDKAKTFERRYQKVSYFYHPRTAKLAKRAHDLANREYEKNIK